MILFAVFGFIVFLFCFVIFFGAPYLPTLSKQKETALDLLDLKEGETLLELGSGDGRVLLAAAKRNLNAVGIELNPILVVISWMMTYKYRKQVKIIWGNLWRVEWPETDGIFVFLMDKFMVRLDEKIKNTQKKPVRVASFTFKIPKKKIAKQKDSVFLYHY